MHRHARRLIAAMTLAPTAPKKVSAHFQYIKHSEDIMTFSTLRGLTAGITLFAALGGTSFAATTFSEPAYDFGVVSSYAVTVDPSHASAYAYSKLLTFNLTSNADVRIDMRALESASKYYSATFAIYNPVFKLYDASHNLLGTSVDDPTFAQSDGGNCIYGYCQFNDGVTLSTSLQAGSYAIEFSGSSPGFNSPTLHFGISKNEAATINEYLKELTPTNAIPEPGTYALTLLGLSALTLRRRMQKKTPRASGA